MIQKLSRNFFSSLSNNKVLNRGAKRWGLKLGASKVVAGLTVESAIEKIKDLNDSARLVTLDHLGEFVNETQEARESLQEGLHTLDVLHEHGVHCTLSVKLTKLGLDVDEALCWQQISALCERAAIYDNTINIDMEDYAHYDQTLDILRALRKKYDNVGTVLQSYLHRGIEDTEQLAGIPLRIVKGAYKESPTIAYQDKKDIGKNFVNMVQTHLLNESYTAIGTHDHEIIAEIKAFTEKNHIPRDMFEFQMLYGFRNDLQQALVDEGYRFRTYVPFGRDWYGYFMRRLAERPQNVTFAIRGMFSK
ncbi:proline dehydrogenase family protein [Salicibibacter cibi]|uniref:proline dehydrogenase n=1 Tax=Salicibibacter cibi TaxID=2743001 RepID=A0A7T7CH63_9BACI|nr:proline dehydrogenase family protein [Salicibibacter cibi]QQK81890.1 proline dehydrogenase family protein [Salicibibacter cibi]